MKESKLSDLSEIAKIGKVFSDETRLKILYIVGKGRLSAVEILRQVDVVQSTLSYHLALMVESKILNAENVWKYTYYTVNTEALFAATKAFKVLTEVTK
jgi:ArsR family transcriptional regulator